MKLYYNFHNSNELQTLLLAVAKLQTKASGVNRTHDPLAYNLSRYQLTHWGNLKIIVFKKKKSQIFKEFDFI